MLPVAAVPGHRRRAAAALLLLGLLAVSSCIAAASDAAAVATVCTQGSSCSAVDTLSASSSVISAAASGVSSPLSTTVWSSQGSLPPRGRQLLQQSSSGIVNTVCSSSSMGSSSAADPSSLLQVAAGLLGDSRLQITDTRFAGSCRALGAAVLGPRHTFAAMFPAAVVLSTGDVQQGAGDTQDPMHTLSTDLQQPGDARIGAYTHDAAVFEIDLQTSPGVDAGEQLVLSYLFGSEEYGSKNPNPDALAITIRPSAGSSSSGELVTTDLAVLPGGSSLQPPSVSETAASTTGSGVHVFSNSGSKYQTALNGFTQVVPSQGFPVQPGSSYTLRIAVADANHGLVDSVLMLPAGTLRLVNAPTAAAGGPYAVAPNSKLSLHGARSSSPNGALLAYRWSVTPFPYADSFAEPVLTATGASAAVASPPAGNYNVTVEVWDVLGGYSASTTALSVDPANVLNWWSATPGFAAPPPAAAPRPNAALAVNGSKAETLLVKARSDGPAVVYLDGSASHDGKGSPLVFAWTVTQTEPVVKEVDVLVGLVQPPRLLQSLEPGVFLVNLDVSGPGGTSSKSVLLTVAANSPPVAMPGGPYTATVGKPVVVDGTGSADPDGDPLTHSWTLSRAGSVIGRYNGSTLSMTLNKPGAYSVQLTVRDDRGGASSATTEINSYHTVPTPPPPPPPAPAPIPVPQGQRSVASLSPAAMAAVPAPAPNARFSAASLPQAAAAAPAYMQQQQPLYQQQQPLYQQQQQPLYQQQQPQQQQQLAMSGYQQQQPYQQQQQLQGYQQMAQPAPQQQVLQPQLYAAGGYAAPQGAYSMPQQQQQLPQQQPAMQAATTAGVPPGLGMCLFTDGKPNYNPSDATAALQGKLSNSYWGPCVANAANGFAAPPGIPTAPALPAAPPPPPAPAAAAAAEPASASAASVSAAEPAASSAVIRSPEAFVKAQGPATQVNLDAGGSAAAPGRSIVAYHWRVLSKADNAVITSVDGQRTPVWLAPGEYSLSLQVTDTAGQTATAEQGFAVGEVARTLAHISSPTGFTEVADSGGSVDVQLSASGSAAGPGKSITGYSWSVTRLPDNSQVATGKGPAATVSLPGGSYAAQLTVTDSAGGSASASQDFAVGSRGTSGTTAVITWPPSLVQSSSTTAATELDDTSSSSSTSLELDASGSMPARSGGSIRQYVWAVLSMPSRQPVANTTGRVAAVRLPPGAYQVGLLVLDADGGTATARKNFVVQADPLASNRAPSIPAELSLAGTAGGSASLPSIADPDGDAVSVSWSLLDQGLSGRTHSGKGQEVSLADVSPGTYLLLVTAVDARGAESSGTGRLTVAAPRGSEHTGVSVAAQGSEHTRAGVSAVRAAAAGGSRQQAVAAPPGPAAVASIFSAPSSHRKLPMLSMPQGSVLALDAAAFHLLPSPSSGTAAAMKASSSSSASPRSYAWELQQRGTGQEVATVYGRMGRFELSNLDAYNIKLAVTDADGQEFSTTGSVRVLDSAEGGGLAEALNPELRPSPVVSVSGQCGPFKARQYGAAVLECPALQLAGLEQAALQWAWKVTPTAGPAAAAASDSSHAGVQAKLGQRASFLGLGPGVYRVELAVGVGGAPSSRNTAYYLATLLQVSPTKQLELAVPPSAVCAGQPVSLEAPDLLLPPEDSQPEFAWRIVRAQPAALGRSAGDDDDGGSGSSADGDGSSTSHAMHGVGKTFGLTVQPGRYDVTLLAKLPDGAVLSGSGVIKAKACVGCKQGVVDIPVPQGSCTASKTQAAEVLSGVLPQGLEVEFAEGTDMSPGLRNVTVVARLASSSSSSKGPSCRALVHFRDAQPPSLALLHEHGVCLAPPNARWSCWHAHQLVSIVDNCQTGRTLSFKVSCGGSSDSDSISSSDSTCQVLPDGRACVRALQPGQVTMLSVAARDAAGNVARPAAVAVRVHASSSLHQECSRPELGRPVVAKVARAAAGSRHTSATAA